MARARNTPEEVLNTVPHIVERIYDENGREIAWIADNYVVKTQEEVDEILREVSKIWSRACAAKARREALEAAKNNNPD